MIEVDIKQLSPDWFKKRTAIPTASCFNRIITTKGEPSKSAKKYIYQLAGESIIGHKVETYTSYSMMRGIDMEPEAIRAYQFITDNTVRQVGLCYQNEKMEFGGSPDGLIDPDGGIEVKCPDIHTHVEYLFKGKLPTTYFQQVQGYLFISGRKWWDFVSYYPGLKTLIVKVKPDKIFHEKLGETLKKFTSELKKTTAKLKAL